MSSLLGSIFGTLGSLFGNFLIMTTTWSMSLQLGKPWITRIVGAFCFFSRVESKSNEVEFFDGTTQWIGTKNEFSDLSRDWFFIQVDKNETLEEAHKRYLDESIAISHKSHSLIDMRKTGIYSATSLRLFQDVTNGLIKSESLSVEDELWTSKASTGSMNLMKVYLKKELIEIKREKGIAGKVAKELLASLWGILYENPRKNGKEGPHRRMKPIILALGRKTRTEIIKPISDHIKRIHTDGLIIANRIDINLRVGSNKGELKCEKMGALL
ncbi:hypothetical protein GLOIN_2v1772900 [Rhizophagus clarus]|uniref:Uncharacterized protein n=1 Tax=Rhizophagus clarus TaxID=94130 RepID=A0A8H3ME41_9GLOM|nr:hypothetical protein GLOIN_2v1772900 [Rhizophagus clarus]